MLDTNLIGRRARPAGSLPPFSDTRPEDYYLEIVGYAMADDESVVVLTADVRSGKTGFYDYLHLELEVEGE